MRLTRWLAAQVPTRETLLSQPFLRPFAHRLTHTSIWHLNRRSVARGVALGLFCGFVLPVGQVFLAALFALGARANLIVAAAATLVTNPFTFPAIYWAAYKLGYRLIAPDQWAWTSAPAESPLVEGIAWLLSVSAPTAVGLLLFALSSAFLGYWVANLAWRRWVRLRWARRCAATREGEPARA